MTRDYYMDYVEDPFHVCEDGILKDIDSVAKPAEPRPSGGRARGNDEVKVPVGILGHLRDLVESVITYTDDANACMARVSVERPSDMDEVVDARAAALLANSDAAKVLGMLNGLIPEEES